MKRLICVFFVLLWYLPSHSQISGDSIKIDFDSFLNRFISRIQGKQHDTILVLFRGRVFNLEKSYSTGGASYIIKLASLDKAGIDTTDLGKKYVRNSQVPFDNFLNFVIHDTLNPSIASASGSVAFVFMSEENWQQFYLDYLIGYDTLLVCPQIDIFRFKEKYVLHQRYLLECGYTKQDKFFLKRTILLRDKKIRFFRK